MGCKKYKMIRTVDVGRKGHHYIKIGITRKEGRLGGRSERIGKLRLYKGYKS